MKPEKRDLTGEKRNVFIVDDHPIVRRGYTDLINKEPDLVVCGEAGEAREALRLIPKVSPDIAIVDISLKGVNGIELIKNIKAQFPNLPILVVSMHDESLYAERAMRAGAKGYLMKQEKIDKFLTAIRNILKGDIFLSDKMVSTLLHNIFDGQTDKIHSPLEFLSDRELEVFELIGHGNTTRQIAEKLHLSIKTIESYRAHLKTKLKLETATQLLQHAIQWVKHDKKP